MEKEFSDRQVGKVRLQLLSWVADTLGMAGKSSEIVLEVQNGESRTVGNVLEELAVKYPRFGHEVFDIKMQNLDAGVNIFLNGKLIALANGLETGLKDGDVLTILPMIEGG